MPMFRDFCSCNRRKEKSRKVCKRRYNGVKLIVWKITFYSNILEESEQHRVAFLSIAEKKIPHE